MSSSVLTYTQTTQLRGAPKKEGRKKGKRGGAKRAKGRKKGKRGGAEKEKGAPKEGSCEKIKIIEFLNSETETFFDLKNENAIKSRKFNATALRHAFMMSAKTSFVGSFAFCFHELQILATLDILYLFVPATA